MQQKSKLNASNLHNFAGYLTVVQCSQPNGLLVFCLIFYQRQVKAAALAIIVLAGRVHLSLNQTRTHPPPSYFSPLPHSTVLLNLSASTTNTESWPQNERTNTVATTIYRLEIFREKNKKKKYFFYRLQIYFPCTLAEIV